MISKFTKPIPSLLSLLFLALLLGSCSYSTRKSIKLFNEAKNNTYDLIVVPGVPLENGQWSQTMRARIYWSKFLFDRGIAKNIMYSGNAVYTPYVESEVMALYAQALGIPKEHIFTESKAEHSTENIYYSYKKAQKLNFKKIALASDPFQTRMLARFTRLNVSRDIDMIPALFDTLRAIVPEQDSIKIDPKEAFVSEFTPLTERKGFLSRFWGTLGKSVDENAYE